MFPAAIFSRQFVVNTKFLIIVLYLQIFNPQNYIQFSQLSLGFNLKIFLKVYQISASTFLQTHCYKKRKSVNTFFWRLQLHVFSWVSSKTSYIWPFQRGGCLHKCLQVRLRLDSESSMLDIYINWKGWYCSSSLLVGFFWPTQIWTVTNDVHFYQLFLARL